MSQITHLNAIAQAQLPVLMVAAYLQCKEQDAWISCEGVQCRGWLAASASSVPTPLPTALLPRIPQSKLMS